jgi:glycosyltransferase involved in cell wall biosynthesis
VRMLADLHPRLTAADRVEVISGLIYHLQPKAVLNVNSSNLWQVIEDRGGALSRITKLYAYVYGRTHLSDGRLEGATDRYFRTCFPYLTRIYSDNAYLRNMLIRDYAVPADLQQRLHVVYQPAQIQSTPFASPWPAQVGGGANVGVFWAGTLNRENNPVLLNEIARHFPTKTFDLYRDGERAVWDALKKDAGSNVRFRGDCGTVDPIAMERYAAIILKSVQDGVPSVVIEAAVRGIPIVASNVGGIGELVDDETGWLIRNCCEPRGYVEALGEIWQNPGEVARRLANMSCRLHGRHAWLPYLQSFSQSPSFLD